MERRILISALFLCSVVVATRGVPAPLNSHVPDISGPGPSDISIVNEDCDETAYCEINMTHFQRILRVGETVPNPTDPCEMYYCINRDQIQVKSVTCVSIDSCADGNAPYKLPGDCCLGCGYLASLFSLAPDKNHNNTGVSNTSRPPPNTWGEWTPWTDCSRSCGKGRQSRMRECNLEGKAVIDCTGDRVQVRPCNTHECPVHGGWSDWTDWSDCSVTCDNGTQSHHRSCTNPAPKFGGRDCEGESVQIKNCFLRHCPINCVWLPWNNWSECNRLCGGGVQSRNRQKIPEQYGGKECEGNGHEQKDCNTHHCPIDGGWTPWEEWSACSKTCGTGMQTRERSCTNPTPQYGGLDCSGERSRERECFIVHCPVHCEWGPFSDWSECSLSCDGGTKRRIRGFSPPLHGGDDCAGDAEEIQLCNTQKCPDPCVDNGNPCFKGVNCSKLTDTEFHCGSCPQGMRGDGIDCELVNECEEALPCFPGVNCTDLEVGYECGMCPVGYTGDTLRGYDIIDALSLQQVCEDINECTLTPNGGCHELRECINTNGSYECGSCISGYVDDGARGCTFADPCAAGVHNCEKKKYCVNYEIGRFYCECPVPLIGNGRQCSPDTDLDGIPNKNLTIGCHLDECVVDNCPDIPNSGQEDFDRDGVGDACDDDIDNDGIKNNRDNCDFVPNSNQLDFDRDRYGDVCDNCPEQRNTDQQDLDGDGLGDTCDSDRDGDGLFNNEDNCPSTPNRGQEDKDRDRRGDLCDNCLDDANFNQVDKDMDGLGDACDNDIDLDKDGVQDNRDNCPGAANADQADQDKDGSGDLCDTDDDNDGLLDEVDNCPMAANVEQKDSDNDGVGDACQDDWDNDGVINSKDICPSNPNISRTDFSNFIPVSLVSGRRQIKPKWHILNNGTEVHQMVNSDPGMLIGADSFRDVEFNGTFFVNTKLDDDYIGIVFNYQSNKRFMLASWKQRAQVYWQRSPFRSQAKAGLQIQSIKSESGPGPMLRNAIWNSGTTKKQVKLLWQDPLNQGWEDKKAYRWNLQYSSNSSCARLRVYSEESMLVDSGCVCNRRVIGGRLGLFVFSQENVIFSNLMSGCLSERDRLTLEQCSAN